MIVKATGAAQRGQAVAYLARRLGCDLAAISGDEKYEVFFACRGEDAQGVVLYKNWSCGDIEMVCAGEPGWVTRQVMRFVFDYPFNDLLCNRVTCLAHRKNKAMRDYLLRMGFRLEGVKRKALNGADLCFYGLLRDEAKRWGC